jgi:NAD(P)-dependent dehydrogenase (short-subunit alcohol dehydrogenase family)
MRLKNKVAIITGVGSGQGRGAATIFAREGAQLVGCDWKREDGEITTSMVKQAGGAMVFAQADVSSAKDCENVVRTAMNTYGRIDILYNNAGV